MAALKFGCHVAWHALLHFVATAVWLREHLEGKTDVWAEEKVVRMHSTDRTGTPGKVRS